MKIFTRKSPVNQHWSFLKACFAVLFVMFVFQGRAQFSISAASTNYTQNFNTLVSTGTGTWTDNSTLTGWYARTDATASISSYGANTGSTATAGLYSYGVAGTNPVTERALGYAASNTYFGASGTGKAYLGWRLVNNTGSAISSIQVTWTGEQWRRDNTAAQNLVLGYRQASTVTDLTTGTYTAAGSTFTSPQIVGAAAALDGNAAANRTAGITINITVNIPAGEEIMLRWEDLNDTGNDHQMAIDDVTINATAAVSATEPTVTTTMASSISTTGAFSGGEVTDDGGASVSARGVAYGTSANPTILGTKTTNGTGVGSFTSSLSGLSVNTQYFYRAYATNTVGTSYGSESDFYTLANTPNAPTVNAPTSSSLNVAIGAGDGNPSSTQYAIRDESSGDYVQADGTLSATEVWQTSSTWSTVTVTGLASSTLYNFEVKARNGANVSTGFGATGSGTTSSAGAQNQTITFNALSNKTYGDASFQLTATASSSLTVSYESSNTNVATISGDIVTIVGAGTTTITASQAGDVNWNPAPEVDQSLTVDPKELTVINAQAQDKTYNGNTTAVITGATLVGVVGLDDVTVSGGGTFATANAGTDIDVAANLTLGGADASNYTLTQPTGLSADINQASQTITFNTLPNKTVSDGPFALTATASSGLTVTYESSNTSVATISGNTVTIVGIGTTKITASQAGNGNYLAADDVIRAQVITAAPSVVTYSFGTVAPGTADPTAGTPITNLSFSSLGRGNNKGTTTLLTTTSPSTGYTGFSASYNAGAAAEVGALDLGVSAYFEFTLTPAAGYKVQLSSISFGTRSTATGPQAYSVRSSLNGYSTNLATGTLPNTSAWVLRSNSVGTESGYGSAITFRIYGHSGSGTAAAGTANWRIDDLALGVLVEINPALEEPTVTTTTASSITATGASSGGEVTNDGGITVTARGVAYGTSANPTTAGTITSDGTGVGTFISTLSGLSVNTQYFYRAYATNAIGTSYGSESDFYTLANTPNAPIVNTPTATTLDVTIAGGDGNPSTTQYAIREAGSGDYVQADGTLGATEVWQTASAWSTVTVTGLASITLYNFDVKARNGSNMETVFSAVGSGTTSNAGAENQTITFNALPNKTYGDASFQLTATASSGLTVSYESSNTNVATISGDIVTIVGAGTTTITASQAGDMNWNPAPDEDQVLTVDTKELIITGASAQDKIYDGTTDAVIIGGTLVGVVGVDDVSFTGGGNFITPDAGPAIAVIAALSLTGADASNYFLTQPTLLIADINQASQTITFNALADKTTADAPFALTATASSGLTVTYESSNTSVATIIGNIVTIVGAGTTNITASQAGNGNYLAADDVIQAQLVTIAPSVVTYTFGTVAPGTANPTSGTPVANLTISAIDRGNNNGTTTLLTTTSVSSGYTGVSGSYNAGAASRTGSLDLDLSAYFDFTLTPASGHKVTLSSISFGSRSTGTGPVAYSVRSSLDNYATDLATGSLTNTSTWILRSTAVGAESAFGAPVTFRLYGHSGTGSAAANTANWRIDDVNLSVVVESAPPCEGTPSAGSISGGDTFCESGSTTLVLTGNSDINAASGLSIQWFSSTNNIDFDPIGAGNELSWPTGTLTQTAYYYAVVTCSNSGLFATTNTESVIIQPNVNPGTVTGTATLCINTTATYSSNGDGGGTWSSSDESVATVNPATGLVTAVGAGTANIIYTISSGCGAPASASQQVSVAVNTAPVVTGPTNVCPFLGNNVQVTYTANTPGATSYTWTLPPNVNVVSGLGTGTLTVTFNAAFGTQTNKQLRVRANSVCGTSELTIYYLLVQYPSTPAPIVASTTNVCPSLGTEVPITFTIPKVTAATSYIWSGQLGTTTINTINGFGENDTTVTVTFTSGFTSSAITVYAVNSCGISGTRSITITRSNPSTPSPISGPTNVCEFIAPNGTAATYSVPLQPNVTTYTWTLPPGAINVTGQGTNSVSFIYPAGYAGGSISVVASNGCGSSAVPRSLSVTRLNPAAPSVIDVAQIGVCPNREYTYSLTGLPANATSIAWTVPVGGTILSGDGTSSITVSYGTDAISGVVTATALNNCGNSATRSSVVKLAACPVEDFAKGKAIGQLPVSTEAVELNVFPNPSVNDFRLQVTTASKDQITVRLLDLQGRELKRMIMMPDALKSFGSDLKPGTYMIEVLQGTKRTIQKIIKL